MHELSTVLSKVLRFVQLHELCPDKRISTFAADYQICELLYRVFSISRFHAKQSHNPEDYDFES
jgi:hypothetical protein